MHARVRQLEISVAQKICTMKPLKFCNFVINVKVTINSTEVSLEEIFCDVVTEILALQFISQVLTFAQLGSEMFGAI